MGDQRLRNAYIALSLMTASALFVFAVRPEARAGGGNPVFGELPAALGAWRASENISFEKRIAEMLGTQDVRGAVYRDGKGRAVQLVIVNALNNRSAFHPPEYCLAGQGSEIIHRQTASFSVAGAPSLRVNEMVLLRDSGKKLFVWNWYVAGKELMPDFYRQQWRLFVEQIRTGASRGGAVNMYLEVEDGDIRAARSTMEEFAGALVPVLGEYL